MRTAKEMCDFCLEHGYNYACSADKMHKHFTVVERNLAANEEVLLAFISNRVQAKTATYALGGTTAVALTSQKLIYAQRRPVMGDFVKMARYDNINDISSNADCLSVEIMIDSLKECMKFSVDRTGVDGIRNKALELIEQHRSRKNATQKVVPQSVVQIGAADEVKKFKELLDLGVISQEEFDAKKKQLLGLPPRIR